MLKKISWLFKLLYNYSIFYEFELPDFDPELDKKGFKESGTIYHCYKNRLFLGADYVGFAQFDMYISDAVFVTIKNRLLADRRKTDLLL